MGIAKVLQSEKHRWNGRKLHHRTCSVYCDTEQKKRFPMAKVHKSVGFGRGKIKADSISPRLYTVKLRLFARKTIQNPVLPHQYSSTEPQVLEYLALSTAVLARKY